MEEEHERLKKTGKAAIPEHKTRNKSSAMKEEYRLFLEHFEGIAYKSDIATWTPFFFHGAVAEITGYASSDFIAGNPSWDQIIHPDDLLDLHGSKEVLSVPDYSTKREYRIIRKNGEIRWVRESNRNVCDESGKPVYVQGTIEDITDRVQAEQAIRESEERYRALESAMFYGVFIHENGIILEVSDTFAAMADYPPEELVGRNIMDCIAPKDHGVVKKALVNPGEEALNYVEAIRRDGVGFPVEVRGKTIQYRGRKARVNVVRDISAQMRLENENLALRAGLDDRDRLGRLIGKSLVMRQVYIHIVQAAATEDAVIIYGETGTGKELASRTIFELSRRSKGPFVTVNCGAVQEPIFESLFFGHKKGAFTGAVTDTPGFFDRADEGTLFLDEIGELSISMQAKLLRVLQDGKYTPVGAKSARSSNVRLISATNRKRLEMLQSGQMREDFFQRIHVIPIEMPPLRNHKEDIGLLVNYFIKQRIDQGGEWHRFPDNLMDRFMAYHWPGNVRELFNELRRYQATAEICLDGGFPGETDMPEGRTYKQLMEDFERRVLAEALIRHGGNRSQVSKVFGIPRKTLQRKIKKYNL